MSDYICVVQLTDTHQFAKTTDSLLKLNTSKSLDAVLDLMTQITNKNPCNLIALTGDISQDGSIESYQRIVQHMKAFSSEVAWVPGNHDRHANMASIFNFSHVSSKKHFIIKNWQIILLDSHVEGKDAGFLDDEQCDFLYTTLSSYPQHALVMLHHHVLPVGSSWLDNINVNNSQDFLDIIDGFTHVKAVVCGHVHQASLQKRKNILFFTSPSACFQFKPHVQNFSLDEEMPGFSLIHLYNDGHVEIEVKRVPYHSSFLPDLKNAGY